MSILETRRHMNLTALVEYYWYSGKELWIVLELCEGGSLNDVSKRLGEKCNSTAAHSTPLQHSTAQVRDTAL